MKKKILCTLSVAVIATVAVATIGCTSKKTESVSPKETETPTPIETSAPTETPVSTETSEPTEVPVPTETSASTETPVPTEDAVKKEENKQEPQKEEPKQEENKTLTLKEAWYLEPSGSYTEKELQVDADIKEITGIDKAVRRTYENGAIRDFIIVSGKESALTVPWGADPAEYSSGVGGVSVEVGTTTNTNKQDTNKQNQNTDKKVVYKGIVPPRSKYSSDAEWKKAADKALAGGSWQGTYFSSEADFKLFKKLCQGTDVDNDDIINRTEEEHKKWAEENGFTVK